MAKRYTEGEMGGAFRAGAKLGAGTGTDSVLGNVAASYKLEFGRKDINAVAHTEPDLRYMDGAKPSALAPILSNYARPGPIRCSFGRYVPRTDK
jgi:hypothetical protein